MKEIQVSDIRKDGFHPAVCFEKWKVAFLNSALQTRSRTIQAQTVCRARILLLKADGEPIDKIADKVGINRCSVMLCLKKFREGGVENALSDAPGRGRNPEITDDEKA